MTNERPTGTTPVIGQRSHIARFQDAILFDPVKNPEFFNGWPEHEEMFSRLLYGLAFFHAVVQERRTFGPLGWNIPYGFNDSDFDISVQQLQMFINESDNPFEALSYLIGECNYGGLVAVPPELEAFSTALMLGRLPTNWAAVSYPSLKNLPSYVSDFLNQMHFLHKWLSGGKPPSYWVSDLFFTQAFLTGVKQNYARKYTIPIDKLTFDFEILQTENSETPPIVKHRY
ncbi:hypothetical protein HUJ05_002100 [Dendroctonus ponderosae]|nr:hypothetical protein HUJ05_002100 [Dendroctonus ponderosae]